MRCAIRPTLLVTVLCWSVLLAARLARPAAADLLPGPVGPARPADVREVTLDTSDGLRLTAWVVPPTGPDRGFAVLVAPGNAGHREHRLAAGRAPGRGRPDRAAAGVPGLRRQPRAPERGGAGPRRPGRTGPSHRRRLHRRPDRLLRREPGRRRGRRAGHRAPAGRARAAVTLRRPALGRGAPLPVLPVRLLLRDRYPLARHVARSPGRPPSSTARPTPSCRPRRAAPWPSGRPATVRVITVDGADHNDPVLAHGRPVVGAVLDAGRPPRPTRIP